MRSLHHTLTAALSCVLIAGCGGGEADTSTVLGTSTTSLTVATSGTARMISVTNKGLFPTRDLRFGATDLPAGTDVRSTCPASLLPGASCLLVATPGAIPSAIPGDPAPLSALIELAGDNTNTLRVQLSVITHGSVHQGGFVFALDDTTALTLSVGGKVLTTADLVGGSRWSPTLVAISGISDNSVAGPESCNGALDGRCNTQRILATYPSGGSDLAAARCVDHRDGGFRDWYLPAFCELTYGSTDPTFPEQALCGTQSAPWLADNARSRLYDQGLFGAVSPLPYWSSTQRSSNPAADATAAGIAVGRNAFPKKDVLTLPVRCARTITP